MRKVLISGRAHPELSEEIAKELGEPLCAMTAEDFPNQETFVQLKKNIRGSDVFIIQPTCAPANQNLMELLIIVDAARRASAGRITAVMPFFGYARQDRKDRPRVPITAKLVANLMTAAGVNRVLTMDLHAGQIQGFFDIPVDHLHGTSAFLPIIKKLDQGNLMIVGPDVGSIKNAHGVSKLMGCPMALVAKNRLGAAEVEVLSVIGDVEGKDILLVDDLTETAGTLSEAALALKERGANDIYAVVSHCTLQPKGRERLKASPIKKLITTNSVPQAHDGGQIETISVAPLFAQAIHRINEDESITSLFPGHKD